MQGWEIWEASLKNYTQTSVIRRLPASISLFSSIHPLPSWKVPGTLKAGHGRFAQVLISHVHIQSHSRFQKNKALSIWQASLMWRELWLRDSQQILLVCCLSFVLILHVKYLAPLWHLGLSDRVGCSYTDAVQPCSTSEDVTPSIPMQATHISS